MIKFPNTSTRNKSSQMLTFVRRFSSISTLEIRTMTCAISVEHLTPGLGSSTVDQVLKYTKYPKYIPSTSTGQVLIFLKST